MSKASLNSIFETLKRDLMAPEGPRVTNMRNYRFAIVPYAPEQEFERNPVRALERVKTNVANQVEGEEGIAADIIEQIDQFADKHPDQTDNTLIWIKRLGSLYPFSRCSNLLKFLDGKTRQIPVVVLYPGVQEGKTALSFMGELPADRDYRPRIYST